MAERRFNPLLLLPPAIFAGLAIGLYFGLMRENPDELPSALQGRPAPSIAQVTALRDDPPPGDDALVSGEVTLVNFWASWCGPCRIEHPHLAALAEEGIPIIGINYKDQPANARAFLDELGDFYDQIGADQTGRTGIDWGIYGIPETFVIDGDGTVLLRFPGPVTPDVVESRIRPAIEAAGS